MWHEYANTWYKIIIISAVLTGREITDQKNLKPKTGRITCEQIFQEINKGTAGSKTDLIAK